MEIGRVQHHLQPNLIHKNIRDIHCAVVVFSEIAGSTFCLKMSQKIKQLNTNYMNYHSWKIGKITMKTAFRNSNNCYFHECHRTRNYW